MQHKIYRPYSLSPSLKKSDLLQASCLMPPITRASCQSENFIITNHNTHYTKGQLISHQHQHTPTPTHANDKIKPNSKSEKTVKKKKVLIKLKIRPGNEPITESQFKRERDS